MTDLTDEEQEGAHGFTTRYPLVTLFLRLRPCAASLAGCGGGGAPGSAATPPARSGQVWEVQGSDDRTAVPGSIVAFVNGVHVMVVDGDRVFAGMTRADDQEWLGRRPDDHVPERTVGRPGAVGAGRRAEVLELVSGSRFARGKGSR